MAARSTRRAAAVVLSLALALAASGCGGDDTTASTGDDGATTTSAPSTSFTYATVPPPAPGDTAPCTTEAYVEAVATDIDGGHYPISNERCDGTWAAFDIDFGADACPPEDDSCRGIRVHRSYWKADGGRWSLIAYQGFEDCDDIQAVTQEFPDAICAR